MTSQSLEQTLTSVLARGARNDDAEAFQVLYDRVAPALYGWCALQIGPRLRQRLEPEELAQETWARALRSIGDFDERVGSFRAWLFGIARHALLEAVNELRRAPLVAGNATARVFALENHPDTVTSNTRRVARDDALRSFITQVGELGEEEQQLTVMCGIEGMSCDAAAERIGISSDAAKKRWQRLRAELSVRESLREVLVDAAG